MYCYWMKTCRRQTVCKTYIYVPAAYNQSQFNATENIGHRDDPISISLTVAPIKIYPPMKNDDCTSTENEINAKSNQKSEVHKNYNCISLECFI